MVPMGGLLFKERRQLRCIMNELCVVQEGFDIWRPGRRPLWSVWPWSVDGTRSGLASLSYRRQYTVYGLEEIGVACQQAGGYAAFR